MVVGCYDFLEIFIDNQNYTHKMERYVCKRKRVPNQLHLPKGSSNLLKFSKQGAINGTFLMAIFLFYCSKVRHYVS